MLYVLLITSPCKKTVRERAILENIWSNQPRIIFLDNPGHARLRQPGILSTGPDTCSRLNVQNLPSALWSDFCKLRPDYTAPATFFKGQVRDGWRVQNSSQTQFRSRNFRILEMNNLLRINSGKKKRFFGGQCLNVRVCNNVIHNFWWRTDENCSRAVFGSEEKTVKATRYK